MKEEGSLGELPDNTETKRVTINCIQKVLSFVYDKEYQYEIGQF